jgi:hypothetical protein
MNKGPSQIAAVLRQRYRPARGSVDAGLVESTVPWTFNQILLPMILVLTAVVLTQILVYRNAIIKLEETENKPKDPTETKRLEINYQYYKLLHHLEQVKAQTRAAYRMTLFPEADRVRRNGSVPNDEDFKVYCSKISQLDSKRTYNDEAARIYAETLARAGIRDPEGTEFDRKDIVLLGNREVSPKDIRKHEELAAEADSIDISYWNRNKIQGAILDFLDGTKQEATELQEQLVFAIRQEMKQKRFDDPESMDLSDVDRQLVEDIKKPETPDQQRQRLGRELSRNLMIQLETRFKDAGYHMIIWKQLRSK